MSNRFRILPVILCALLVPAFAGPAPAVAKAGAQSGASSEQSRLGRGFGRRSPSFRTRPRTSVRRPIRPFARRGFARRFFSGALKALGLAYLFHLMFGWGAGGSPFGLLLLLAIVLFFATRRRRYRRRPAYY
jgi:hypothetical protein